MLVCAKGLEVKPQRCGAGWYLGTWDDDGPRCRLSTGYTKTAEEAQQLAADRRHADENRFCSGGDCCIREV